MQAYVLEASQIEELFDDWNQKEVQQLCEGLQPFIREGNWVAVLCNALEGRLKRGGK